MFSTTATATITRSWEGCPAPAAAEVLEMAQLFGVGVVALRSSSRSFSGWVAVCSFPSREAAVTFAEEAAYFLGEGCFCKVRQFGKRFRVSVPVLSPPSLVFVRRRCGSRWFRLGRRFVRLG